MNLKELKDSLYGTGSLSGIEMFGVKIKSSYPTFVERHIPASVLTKNTLGYWLARTNGGSNSQTSHIFTKDRLLKDFYIKCLSLLNPDTSFFNDFCKINDLRCQEISSYRGKAVLETYLSTIHEELKKDKAFSSSYLCHFLSAKIKDQPGTVLASFVLITMAQRKDGESDIIHAIEKNLNTTPSVLGRNIPPISSLSPYCIQTQIMIKASLKPFMGKGKQMHQIYTDYSRLFSYVLQTKSREIYIEDGNTDILENLYRQIKRSKSTYLLKLEGKPGTEKNTLVQLLYIRFCNDYLDERTSFLPFYFSLHAIAKEMEKSPDFFSTMILPIFTKYLEECNRQTEKIPLIFIDDIVDYDWGKGPCIEDISIDYYIQKIIRETPRLSGKDNNNAARFIVSIDTGFRENQERKRKDIPFVSDTSYYAMNLSTVSIQLTDKKRSLDFLFAYSDVNKTLEAEQVRPLHGQLISLGILSIDIYLLKFLIPRLKKNTKSLIDLYAQECAKRFNANQEDVTFIASYAYGFLYKSNPYPENYYTKAVRKLMHLHMSFITYLAARHIMTVYLGIKDDDSLRPMVMPKTLTKFMVEILNSSSDYRSKFINYAFENYSHQDFSGKSSIAYLLSKVRDSTRIHEIQTHLKIWLQMQKDYITTHSNTMELYEKRLSLFLERTLSISLIGLKEPGQSEKYIESLLADDLANDINRGFQLEYYGDIYFMPDTGARYTDDPYLGEKAINRLLTMQEDFLCDKKRHIFLDLNMFTICSLLQNRYTRKGKAMNVFPYMEKTLSILKKYNAINTNSDKITAYFLFMQRQLEEYLSENSPDYPDPSCRIYGSLASQPTIKENNLL